MRSDETVWKGKESSVITRGIAVNKDYIFIGRLEYGNRLSRRWSNGGFWVLDRKTLKTLDTFKIPRTGGINEVRLIGDVDNCHNAPVIHSNKLECIKNIPHFNRIRKTFNFMNYTLKKSWKA